MEMIIAYVLVAIGSLVVGGGIALIYKRMVDEKKKKTAEMEAERIVNRARSEASKIDREAKQKAKDFETRARRNAEGDIQKQKQKLKQEETQIQEKEARLVKELQGKESDLANRANEIIAREEKIKISEKRLNELNLEMDTREKELKAKLERVAQMSQDEAKRELVDALSDEARTLAAKKAMAIEEEFKLDLEKKTKRMMAMAMARYAAEYTSERTVSVMTLPGDEMKGKIIGREGRNIRALEAATGVDLIVDETPEAVVISGFDPVRREVARLTLEKLIEDGRVHPARIEEVVDKVKKDLIKSIREEGEKATYELGLHGLHPEVLKTIGMMKYRNTVTQNLLTHSMEVAYLSGLMAGDLGIDVKKARRAGLLHDIGKALDHSVEGSHAMAGAEFLKKYNESAEILHAIRAHRDEEKPESLLAFVVQAANILSNSRPGARRPQMDSYIRRLEDMESIGNSFDGVVRTFALQAGKELKVLVESSLVTDDQLQMLSYDVARKIEREVKFPGQVKITVVRETRVVEHAR